MSANLTITPFDGKLVTIDSPLSYDEVTARLEAETNKTGATGNLVPFLASPPSKEAIIEKLAELTGDDRHFTYFLQMNHGTWIQKFDPDAPRTSLYMVGNPVIAHTMIKYDLRAAYNVPPRVMVFEKIDGTGTSIVYHLPSSVMAIIENPDLRAASEVLDSKLEQMLMKVASSDLKK